jgi:hypothetical protein
LRPPDCGSPALCFWGFCAGSGHSHTAFFVLCRRRRCAHRAALPREHRQCTVPSQLATQCLPPKAPVLVYVGAAATGVLSGAWYGFAVPPRARRRRTNKRLSARRRRGNAPKTAQAAQGRRVPGRAFSPAGRLAGPFVLRRRRAVIIVVFLGISLLGLHCIVCD